MERVLVTGAFGNVGRSAIAALVKDGVVPVAFDCPTARNRGIARALKAGGLEFETVWGDIRDAKAVSGAVSRVDTVIHLAAIIPPLADRLPGLAREVNVGGTENAVRACERFSRPLAHASSVALYGDRVADPYIRVSDPIRPSEGDNYGELKAEAEGIVKASGAPWSVLRLSYVVWRKKLAMDPLMFRMPLATKIEIIHTEDAGRAFARACLRPECAGKTFNIGGGESCRTTYRDYLVSMLSLFGLKNPILPEAAFSKRGYHCGWLDTAEAEDLLGFQKKTLADYYVEVAEEARLSGLFASLFPRAILGSLMRRSPYFASPESAGATA